MKFYYRMFSLVLLLLINLNVLGNEVSAKAQLNQKTWTKDNVFVEAILDKKEYIYGEQVVLRIKMINKSIVPIEVTQRQIVHNEIDLSLVNDENKKEVPLSLWGNRYRIKPKDGQINTYRAKEFTIPKDESYKAELVLSRIYDLTLSSDYSIDIASFFRIKGQNVNYEIKDLKFSILEKSE